MGKGIDYGLGQTNIDHATGIRFGVIHSGEVRQAWEDSSEADYREPTCPKCGNEATNYDGDARDEHDQLTHAEWNGYTDFGCCDYVCQGCQIILDSADVYGDEPMGWNLDDGEYVATQGGDDCDIFVAKSPYYTRAEFCSPCAPGACYLANPDEDGERAYCFGHDWFDGGVAPYPVYSVATGQPVPPK